MTSSTVVHLEPREIVGYARGTLTAGQARHVRIHCADCEDCGDQLAAVLLLRRDVVVQAPASRRWLPLAAAAALMAVALLGWWTATRGEAPAGTALSLEGRANLTAEVPPDGDVRANVAIELTSEERMLAQFMADAPARDLGQVAATAVGREEDLPRASQLWLDGDIVGLIEALEPYARTYDPIASPVLAVAIQRLGASDGRPLLRWVLEQGAAESRGSRQHWLYAVRELGGVLHADGDSVGGVAVLDEAIGLLDQDWLQTSSGLRILELRERIAGELERGAYDDTSR